MKSLFAAAGSLCLVFGIGSWVLSGRSRATESSRTVSPPVIQFTDATAESGIRFTHKHGGSGRHYYVETMGGGGAFLDYAGDGWLDILLVQGTPLPGYAAAEPLRSHLYRNNQDGTFTEAGKGSGLDASFYGLGAAVGDYDRDGKSDLYVTALGGNHLFHNEGGRFRDVTKTAGVHAKDMSTGAAWLDYDRDGFLDLFVCRYMDYDLETNPRCKDTNGRLAYCSPNVYTGTTSRLYRNEGDGTFTDVSIRTGIGRPVGRSMGTACADYNDDGWPDIYVSNDLSPNLLFMNDRKGGFRDEAALAGVSHGESGTAFAGMGVDCGDYDNDGQLDLVVTNFEGEPISIFRGAPGATFTNESFRCGIGSVSLPYLKWGCRFVDLDMDGYQDLFVANGHVDDYADERDKPLGFAQPCQVWRNERSGTFTDISRTCGPFFARKQVARGAAFGAVHHAGAMDVLVIANNGRASLLRNDSDVTDRWVRLSLAGSGCNPEALGARVRLAAGGMTQTQFVRSAGSYLADHDRRLLFGVPQSQSAEVEIRWPCGSIQIAQVTAGKSVIIKESRCKVVPRAVIQ